MAGKQAALRSPSRLPRDRVPPLEAGDRLTRAEFHRRYTLHPEITKAELIDGVVYMPSPIGIGRHSVPHAHVMTWLTLYSARTPGVLSGSNGSVFLDPGTEVQPDAMLWLDSRLGGQARLTEDDHFDGAPELAVEIAASSASIDMHLKRAAYERNGVQEYVVVLTYDRRVVWLALDGGTYAPLPAEEGILRSRTFPGLWLAPEVLLAGDISAVLTTLESGLASPDHATFRAELAARAEHAVE
jgi:Uma2 family endonuclease